MVVRRFGVGCDLIIVIAINKRGIREEFFVKDMVPAQGTGGIAPINTGKFFLAQHIAAEIAGKKELVFFTQLEIEFCIQVVEIKT